MMSAITMQSTPTKVQDMLKRFETNIANSNSSEGEKPAMNGVKMLHQQFPRRGRHLTVRTPSPSTVNICTWSVRRRRDPRPASGESSLALGLGPNSHPTSTPTSFRNPASVATTTKTLAGVSETGDTNLEPHTSAPSGEGPGRSGFTGIGPKMAAQYPTGSPTLTKPAPANGVLKTTVCKRLVDEPVTETSGATPGPGLTVRKSFCANDTSDVVLTKANGSNGSEVVRVMEIARLFQEKAESDTGPKLASPRSGRCVVNEPEGGSGQLPKSDLPPGPPPQKPARTFAHDIYCQNKFQQPSEVHGSKQLARTHSDQAGPEVAKPKPPPKPVRSKTVPAITRSTTPQRVPPDCQCTNAIANRPQTPPPKPPPVPTKPTFPVPYASVMVATANPFQDLRSRGRTRNRRHDYGVLKRCFSEERVYDEPYRGLQRPHTRLDRRKSPSLALDKLLSTDVVFIDNEVYHGWSPLGADRHRSSYFHTRSLKSKKPPVELHYMSSPIIATMEPSPTAPKDVHAILGLQHESVKARNHNSEHSTTGRAGTKRVNFMDNDVVDWSFYSIYATNPRNRRRPTSKDEDSGDSESEISEKVIEKRIAYIHRVSRGPSMYRDLMSMMPNYRRHFDAVLTVGLRYMEGTKIYEPYVKEVFPGPESLTVDLEDVAHFCFPDAESWRPIQQRETYTFVLTNQKGDRVFGYCRRVKPDCVEYSIPIVYCIISPILARAYYGQVLCEIEKRHGLAEVKMRAFLQTMQSRSVPAPGRTVTFKCVHLDSDDHIMLSRSSEFPLDNADVSRLLTHMSIQVLLKAIASILLERRVIFLASKPEVLTESIHALLSLLYPFSWQHTLVPILPMKLLDVVASPTPYVIGILRSSQMRFDDLLLEEGIIVDLDSSHLIREVGDERTVIPKEIQRALSTALKLIKSRSDVSETPLSSLVSRAFLRMFIELIGHYPQHMSCIAGKQRIFHRESFCSTPASQSIQMFLKWFTETPMFDRFIEDRTTRNTDNDFFEQCLREQQLASDGDPLKGNRKYNVKEFSKKMRNFGEKLIGYKPPLKA